MSFRIVNTFAIPALACILAAPAPAQGYPCSNATPISGLGAHYYKSLHNTQNWGSLCAILDENVWYWRWTAEAPGDYSLWVNGHAAGIGVYRQPFCQFTNLVSCNTQTLANVAAGDEFLIELPMFHNGQDSYLGIGRPCATYSFPDDAFEDNDSLATPVLLPTGDYKNLYVEAGDPDFFEVLVPAGETLVADLNPSSNQQPLPSAALRIYNANDQLVHSGGIHTDASFFPNFAAPTRATIEVVSGACGYYDLLIVTRPEVVSSSLFCAPATPRPNGFPVQLTLDLMPGTAKEVRFHGRFGPQGSFAYLIMGSQSILPGMPMGAQKFCIAGNLARLNVAGTPLNSLGQFGFAGYWTSFENSNYYYSPNQGPQGGYGLPNPLAVPLGSIQAGSSWSFQLWFRELNGLTGTSNGVTVQY